MSHHASPRLLDLFETAISVPTEEVELELRGHEPAPWADFFLNPRRLRGSDFLMRWSQGVWSEHRLIEAVNDTGEFYALPYGPSSVAPEEVREFELYFERLEAAGLHDVKRPDLLIYRAEDKGRVQQIVSDLGGKENLPFEAETHPLMAELVSSALIAVECENSLWKAQKMRDYGCKLRPMPRLGGKLGLPKGATLPTVILKEEDRVRLRTWQEMQGRQVHIWHVFYDLAYGIAFDDAERLIEEGCIGPTNQTFQAPGGALTRKAIYKIYYHYAYPLAVSQEDPELVAEYLEDKSGHILPYVRFRGGRLRLSSDALNLLRGLG